MQKLMIVGHCIVMCDQYMAVARSPAIGAEHDHDNLGYNPQ